MGRVPHQQITTNLNAEIVASVDLDDLFSAPTLKGLVAFDIRIEKGEICIGKRVFVSSRLGKEAVTIEGIELISEPADPQIVRILCTKPKTIEVPLSEHNSWTIGEE